MMSCLRNHSESNVFPFSSSCCSKLPSVIEPHFLSAPCQRTKTNVGLGLKKGWGVVFEKHLFNGLVPVKHINICWFFFQILYALHIKRRTLRWTGVCQKIKKRLFGFAYLLHVQCPHTLHVHVWLSLLKKNKHDNGSSCIRNWKRAAVAVSGSRFNRLNLSEQIL